MERRLKYLDISLEVLTRLILYELPTLPNDMLITEAKVSLSHGTVRFTIQSKEFPGLIECSYPDKLQPTKP